MSRNSGNTPIARRPTEAEEIYLLKHQLTTKDAEIAQLKTVPMRYRRMAFNAQLQDENEQLRQQLAEREQERRGVIAKSKMHPLWLEQPKEVLLDALRFQGATTAALLETNEQLHQQLAAKDALIREAFNEGFRSVRTYNDTVLNSEDDAWEDFQRMMK